MTASRSDAPTRAQIRAYKTLLAAAGLKHREDDLLSAYEVESCKDLSAQQIGELIEVVKSQLPPQDVPPAIRRARSTVLLLLTDLGFHPAPGGWARVNAYLEQPRIAGKRLYDCDLDELKSLAAKLRAIINKRQAQIEEEMRKAANN